MEADGDRTAFPASASKLDPSASRDQRSVLGFSPGSRWTTIMADPGGGVCPQGLEKKTMRKVPPVLVSLTRAT